MLEIFWEGNSGIRIESKNVKLGLNPKKSDDLDLIIATKKKEYKVTEQQFLINSPGEYEARSAMVYALIDAGGRESKAYQIVFEEVSFFYCDNLDFMPTDDQLDTMSTIDIAFIPMAIGKDNEKHIQKLVEAIEPRVIIPIASDDEASAEACTMLAKTLGLKCEPAVKSYKIKDRANLPDEEQLFVSLSKV